MQELKQFVVDMRQGLLILKVDGKLLTNIYHCPPFEGSGDIKSYPGFDRKPLDTEILREICRFLQSNWPKRPVGVIDLNFTYLRFCLFESLKANPEQTWEEFEPLLENMEKSHALENQLLRELAAIPLEFDFKVMVVFQEDVGVLDEITFTLYRPTEAQTAVLQPDTPKELEWQESWPHPEVALSSR